MVEISAVKKSYYNLARSHHPDRVSAADKQISIEKFCIIHQAYVVLANSETKMLYDDGNHDVLFSKKTIAGRWEQHLTTVTTDTAEKAKHSYQGSVKEERDVIREVVKGNGSMIHLLNHVPFMSMTTIV